MDNRLRLLKRLAENDPSVKDLYIHRLEEIVFGSASPAPTKPVVALVGFIYTETDLGDIEAFSCLDSAYRYAASSALQVVSDEIRAFQLDGQLGVDLYNQANEVHAQITAHILNQDFRRAVEIFNDRPYDQDQSWFEVGITELRD